MTVVCVRLVLNYSRVVLIERETLSGTGDGGVFLHGSIYNTLAMSVC